MKGKNKTKLSQLEKQFSDLAKDVSELRQTLAKDVEVDVEEVEREIYTTGKKWFKDESYPNWLMCFDYENNKYYGIDIHGNWHCKEDDIRQHFSHEKEATPQEVQTALENEAKKRGFNEGVKFINFSGVIQTFLGFSDYWHHANSLTCKTPINEWEKEKCNSNPYIFKDGKFAEIIQKETIKEEEIDFSVPQLVISKNENKVISITGEHNEDSFTGLVNISDNKYQPVNYYSKGWIKDCFKPFKGELRIK